MSSEDAENAAYVQQASKIDSFMGKLRYAKAKGLNKVVADKFVFDHFVGADYDVPKSRPMFCMDGVEVYQVGKVPEDLQDELKSK